MILALKENPLSLSKNEKVLYFSLVVCLKEYVALGWYDEKVFPNLLDLFREKEKLRLLMDYMIPQLDPFYPEDMLDWKKSTNRLRNYFSKSEKF